MQMNRIYDVRRVTAKLQTADFLVDAHSEGFSTDSSLFFGHNSNRQKGFHTLN